MTEINDEYAGEETWTNTSSNSFWPIHQAFKEFENNNQRKRHIICLSGMLDPHHSRGWMHNICLYSCLSFPSPLPPRVESETTFLLSVVKFGHFWISPNLALARLLDLLWEVVVITVNCHSFCVLVVLWLVATLYEWPKIWVVWLDRQKWFPISFHPLHYVPTLAPRGGGNKWHLLSVRVLISIRVKLNFDGLRSPFF